MITLNIMLPARGDILQVSCAENEFTESLMDLLGTLLHLSDQKEKRSWLCHVDKRRLLLHHKTLSECGVENGSNLILV